MAETTPVAQNVVPPNPMQGINTFSGILGIQRQQQQLQTGQYQQQAAQSEAQGQQQSMNARLFMGGMMRSGKDENGDSILGADGSPDPDKLVAAINRNVPAQLAQPMVQSILKTQSDKANLDDSLRGLGQNYKNDMSGIVRSFVGKNAQSQDVTNTIDNYVSQNPRAVGPAHWATNLLDSHFDNMNPAQKDDALTHLSQQLQPAAVTAATQGTTPIAQQTNRGVQLFESNRFAPGGAGTPLGPVMQNTAPPGVGVAPSGQLVPTGAGGIGGPRYGVAPGTGAPAPGAANAPSAQANRPRTASDDAPPPNAPRSVQESYAAAVGAANSHVASTRTEDQQYGTNMAIAHSIRTLSQSTSTGPGTAMWNRGLGYVKDDVSNYQLLGAYLDRQSAMLRSQMGLPETNAGQSQAQLISGNTEYQRGAIQNKNNLNEALTEGLHQYRQGLDRVEGFTGTPSPRAIQQYRSAWASNFDPTAQEYRLAVNRGDSTTVHSIISGLSPQERQQLAAKGRNLDALSATGQLPQQ